MQLVKLKQRLVKWREVTAIEFPDRPDLLDFIPTGDEIDISKLKDGTLTTDTCNSVQKVRQILVELIGQVHEQDCFNHL